MNITRSVRNLYNRFKVGLPVLWRLLVNDHGHAFLFIQARGPLGKVQTTVYYSGNIYRAHEAAVDTAVGLRYTIRTQEAQDKVLAEAKDILNADPEGQS